MENPYSTHKKTSEANIEGHLVKLDQWLSDLDFTAEEIRFFKKVVNLYIRGSDADLEEKIDLVEKEISGLEEKSDLLKAELLGYRQSLELEGIQQTDVPLEIILKDKLIYLQQRFNDLNHDIRLVKEDLFSITEELYGN